MEPALVKGLESIVGKDEVITTRERMLNYLSDESPPMMEPKPAKDIVVVKPSDTKQISSILKFANEHAIPVFVRGGGTGLVAGAVPTRDGIVLSLERLNEITVDKDNLMAVAGAGVTLGKLLEAARGEGLAFPPHPGDENAQVGGLVATNAGGSRAVRHGVMRNHVRAIEVVLPTGEILTLGAKVHKNNAGYDLMQLIIGSEGTLGIVTQATIQLYETWSVSYSNRPICRPTCRNHHGPKDTPTGWSPTRNRVCRKRIDGKVGQTAWETLARHNGELLLDHNCRRNITRGITRFELENIGDMQTKH